MLMDVAVALFAVISFVMGASLLYCAYTAQTFGQELSEMAFGLYTQKEANDTMYILTAGLHYNSTGMFSVCCTLMCLLGVCRRKHFISKLAHLVPALMMAAVVVLTQSRTARYSMLVAWARAMTERSAAPFYRSRWTPMSFPLWPSRHSGRPGC